MESSKQPSPNAAHEAMRDIEQARANLAARVESPWWYRVGAALATTSIFVGMGLTLTDGVSETLATTVLVLGAIVGPAALLAALKRSTGISVDRYAEGLGSWYVIVFGLLVVSFALQLWVGVPHAMLVAGVVAGVCTLLRERRIDDIVRRRIRAGEAGG